MKYLFKKKALHILAAVFDAVGGLLFIFSRTQQKKAPKDGHHFLVVRLDHLGDILFATAVPKLLKENLGASQVSFLTSSVGAVLLENNPFVDRVLIYDAPWFSRSKKTGGESYGGIIRCLKQMNVDAALSLRGDLRENLLLFLARSPERVGYGVTGGGFLLTRELPYRWGAHEREHSLDILRSIGVEAPVIEPRIYFSADEEKNFGARSKEWGIENVSCIGVQLEAGARAKEWPEENARRFLKLAVQKMGRRSLVFIGTDKKRFPWITQFLADHPGLPWTDLIGKTNVRELAYCLSRFSAFVGPDSGPAHVSASFGIPTLFLYSGTNVFEEWRSLAENAEFLRNPVSCSPCHELNCPVTGHPCMTGIEPERVVDWILERSHER